MSIFYKVRGPIPGSTTLRVHILRHGSSTERDYEIFRDPDGKLIAEPIHGGKKMTAVLLAWRDPVDLAEQSIALAREVDAALPTMTFPWAEPPESKL